MQSERPNMTLLLDTAEGILAAAETRDKKLQALAGLLHTAVDHYDWVGFYLVDENASHLILGPFVGAPTEHVKIAFGNGVCGQVAMTEKSRIIQDVEAEANYLSCSSDVRSELVFPIHAGGRFVAELDIDSHALAPFGEWDQQFLEQLCKKLESLF